MTLWIQSSNTRTYGIGRLNADLSPCPSIMAGGMGGGNPSQYWLEEDGMTAEQPVTEKPPYRLPTMDEVNVLPWNGYSAISTFSGCGGSSLGYRMAGFRVLWANEFIPEARDCYRLNFPEAVIDQRDIRVIQPAEVLSAIGMKAGELDLFDGSPPCASFSTAGKREANWGKVKAYSSTTQRVDDLFFEYARLLKGIQPKVFIAENVSGLVKGTAKGYFKEILAALKACGYRVEARVLDAQWLGVPQMRQRLIFQGVREDLPGKPAFPKPWPFRYSVRDALPQLTAVQRSVGFKWNHNEADHPGDGHGYLPVDQPMPTVLHGTHVRVEAPIVGIEDANGYSRHAFYATDRPMDTIQAQRPERVAVQTPDYAADRRANSVDESEPRETVLTHPRGWNQTVVRTEGRTERRKFTIAELKAICAFPADFQLVGTYAQKWERLGRAVPPLMMKAIAEALRDTVLPGCHDDR